MTACEHAIATWLPSFGERLGGVDMATMALMTSVFWCTITLTRLGWTMLSTQLDTAWPVLFFDATLVLGAAFLYVAFASSGGSHALWLLWIGSLGMGVGMASAYPCAQTLPEEANFAITPTTMLAFNLCGTAGEMLGPAVIGVLFDIGRYSAMGWMIALLQIGVLCIVSSAYRVANRRKDAPH